MTSRIIATIMLTAVIVTMVRAAEHSAVSYCIESDEQEKKVQTLMFEAMDEAFKEHMKHLFDVWVKEQAEEPEHAKTGAQIGLSAYTRAHKSVVNWKPQRCLK